MQRGSCHRRLGTISPSTPVHLVSVTGRQRERLILGGGLVVAVAAGVLSYRVVGPYGDGPFGAGYRRVSDPISGRTELVYEHLSTDAALRAVVRSGHLSEFRIDMTGDGREDTRAYVEDGGLVRAERDLDGDGLVDRWEDYDPTQDRQQVGFSLGGDGRPDAWARYDDAGALVLIEVSTGRDGIVNRWEHYHDGTLVRVDEDTDGD